MITAANEKQLEKVTLTWTNMAVKSRSSNAKINHVFITGKHTQRTVMLRISCFHGDRLISFTELWENLSGGDEMYYLCNPLRHSECVRLQLYDDPYILCIGGGHQRRLDRLVWYGKVGLWTWIQSPRGSGGISRLQLSCACLLHQATEVQQFKEFTVKLEPWPFITSGTTFN